MKLIGIGNGKMRGETEKGLGTTLSSILTSSAPDKPEAKKEPDVLGQTFERMAGSFDHISAALGTVRSIESLVAETRRAMEGEFAERRKDQGELAALRVIAEQAPLDLAAARQSEAVARAKLSDVTSDLEALRVAQATLETRVREAENEVEHLRATLGSERKIAGELAQSMEKLGAKALHLEADLSAAEAQIQTLETRSRDAEAS
jgi:chromosome segregation ATPase